MNFEVYISGLLSHAGPIFCVFLAAFLQSVTGFGLVMVAAPLLMFFYEPKLTIIIMFFLAGCGNSVQLLLLWKQVNWQRIAELACGALIGVPLGLAVFRHLPEGGLKVAVSVVILFTLVIMNLGRKRFEETRRNTVLTGALAGIMAMTTGMAGPPLVLYFAYTTMPQNVFRATCIGYFFFSNLCSLAALWIAGVPLGDAAGEVVYLLPGLACGIALGHWAFRYMPQQMIRKIIIILLYATCLYNIFKVKNILLN